jgi:hypothetical protein
MGESDRRRSNEGVRKKERSTCEISYIAAATAGNIRKRTLRFADPALMS